MTIAAFSFALQLNLAEALDLLGRAGFRLSYSNKFDLTIVFFIEHEIYDTYTVNLSLFDQKQPQLGE